MPTWLVSVLEWGVAQLLQHLTSAQAKEALCTVLTLVDEAIQAADARVNGPFKGVADEVALAFHTAVTDIVAVLKK